MHNTMVPSNRAQYNGSFEPCTIQWFLRTAYNTMVPSNRAQYNGSFEPCTMQWFLRTVHNAMVPSRNHIFEKTFYCKLENKLWTSEKIYDIRTNALTTVAITKCSKISKFRILISSNVFENSNFRYTSISSNVFENSNIRNFAIF